MKIGDIIKISLKDSIKVVDIPLLFMIITLSAILSSMSVFLGELDPFSKMILMILFLMLGFLMSIMRIESFYLFKRGDLSRLSFSSVRSKYRKYVVSTLSIALLTAFTAILAIIVADLGIHIYTFFTKIKVTDLWKEIIETALTVLVLIYIIVRLGFYSYAVVIEQSDKAIERSFNLTKGNFFKIALIFLTVGLASLPYIFISGILRKIHMTNIMAEIFSLPFLIIFLTYYLAVYTNTFLELKKEEAEKMIASIKDISNFNKKAKTWEDERKRKMSEDFFAKVKDEIDFENIETMLDFGAGTGLMTMQFKDYVKNIDALDSSNGMLEVLKEKIEHYDIENIEIINDRIENLEKTYDLVFSSMVFHHIEDIDELVKNIKDKLNSNGIVVTVDLLKEDGSFHQNMDGIFYHGFDEEEIKGHFEKNGFSKIELRDDLSVKKTGKDGEIKEYKVFLLKAYKGE